MSLIPITSMCPKGTHTHRKNTLHEREKKIKDGFTPNSCIVCHPGKRIFDFGCPNYPYNDVIYLTRESKIALMCSLNRFSVNWQIWVPLEIQWMILDFFKMEVNPYHIYDLVTKSHFEKCKYCGEKLIQYLDENSCPHHIIIRS